MGERALIVMLLFFGSVCLAIPWNPQWLGLNHEGSRSTKVVGLLQKRNGDVRRRAAGEVAWHDIMRARIRVDDGDTIFTGPTGEAELKLNMGIQASLAANSIVVVHDETTASGAHSQWYAHLNGWLHQQTVRQRLSLTSGSLLLRGLSRAHPMDIETNGRFYRIETAASLATVKLFANRASRLLSISANPNAKVRVVSLSSPGPASLHLSSGRSTDQTAPESHGLFVKPLRLKPVEASTELFDENHFNYIPIHLTWPAVPKARAYLVQVFHGTSLIANQLVSAPSAAIQIKTVNQLPYFYKVSAILRHGLSLSGHRQIIAVDFVAPKIRLPVAGSTIRRFSYFLVAWQRTLITNSYRIQISNDANFKNLQVDQRQRTNAISYQALRRGRIFVRVKSLAGKTESAWSIPIALRIE